MPADIRDHGEQVVTPAGGSGEGLAPAAVPGVRPFPGQGWLNPRAVAFILAFALLIGLIGLQSPESIRPRHLMVVARQSAELAIAGIGQTFVMLTGGIDLSQGEMVLLSELLTAGVMNGQNARVPIGLLTVFGVALLAGLTNGLLAAKTSVPPLIITLATGSVLRGVSLIYTGGAPRGSAPPWIQWVGNASYGGVPVALVVLVLLTAGAVIALQRTAFGRMVYYVGGNPTTAYLAGLPRDRVVVAVYTISSLCAAAAGVLLTGYIGMATFEIGEDFMLNPLAAAVIGGTTFDGGVGGALGTVLGAFIMKLLDNLLTITQVPYAGKLLVRGLLIGGIVLLYQRSQRREAA